jgi:hypothetical protein
LLVSIDESIKNWDRDLVAFNVYIREIMQRDEESKWLMRKIVDIKLGRSGLM